MSEILEFGGARFEVGHHGAGSPLVLITGEMGSLYCQAAIDELAARFHVLVPELPGWGGSEVPRWVRSVADVADFCAEWLSSLPTPVPVVGLSLGGWVAAELAIRCSHLITRLALVSPLGLKTGAREDREFIDIYATDPQVVRSALYADPTKARAIEDHSDEELLYLAKAEEAVARLAWAPYLHDPRLGPRLRRIEVPTIVISGGCDRFVIPRDHFATFSDLIGSNALHLVLEQAGHRIEEEVPSILVDHLVEFMEAPVPAIAAAAGR